MKTCLTNDIILIRYPFTDLSTFKVRPAVIISSEPLWQDIIIVPITSKINALLPGEFLITEQEVTGLNVLSAVKRGVFTIDKDLIIKTLGVLSESDSSQLRKSLLLWLGIDDF